MIFKNGDVFVWNRGGCYHEACFLGDGQTCFIMEGQCARHLLASVVNYKSDRVELIEGGGLVPVCRARCAVRDRCHRFEMPLID